jgi:hypothetical protein
MYKKSTNLGIILLHQHGTKSRYPSACEIENKYTTKGINMKKKTCPVLRTLPRPRVHKSAITRRNNTINSTLKEYKVIEKNRNKKKQEYRIGIVGAS